MPRVGLRVEPSLDYLFGHNVCIAVCGHGVGAVDALCDALAVGLRGYLECLERLGDTTEAAAIRPLRAAAPAKADVETGASCACRRGHDA